MATKRRFAYALDRNVEFINLAALRALVQGADAEGMADDSRFEIHRPTTFVGKTFLVLNEVVE